MHRRLVTAGAIAAVLAAAGFLTGSGVGSSAVRARGVQEIPAGLADAIHARLGARPIRLASRQVDHPQFGIRLAVSADGTTALVSAPGVAGGSGAVYVFHVSAAGSWASSSTPVATLTSGKRHGDFGDPVALSADGTTAFVGAPLNGSFRAGAVFVFHVSGEAAWASASTPTATLTISHSFFFGSAVAISHDGTTLVTGAETSNGDAGGAYIFHVSAEDAWVSSSNPTAFLSNAAESGADSGVGAVVAMSGDGTTALLSDAGADSGAGGAYVFHAPSEAGWATSSTPTAILSDANGSENNALGDSLALSGDGTTAFLGDPGVNGQIGAIDVFQASAEDAWASSSAPTAVLTNGSGELYDELGAFVRVATDGETVVATSLRVEGKAGAAYVFHVPDEGAWTSSAAPTATLTDSARVPKDFMGAGLAISGDGATVLVGAPWFDWDTGVADLFHAADAASWLTSSTPTARLTNSAFPKPACVVPKLVGLSVAFAKSVLPEADCRLGRVTRVHTKTKKWRKRIVSQNPQPNNHRAPGSAVNVKVGK